jgi:hypothetical protein
MRHDLRNPKTLIGVLFEWILKGRPTAAGAAAAQGAQDADDSTDAQKAAEK